MTYNIRLDLASDGDNAWPHRRQALTALIAYQAPDFVGMQEVLQHQIFWKIPNDYRTAAGALARGVPIASFEGGSKLARSYAQLASKLGGAPEASGNGAYPRPRLARLFGAKKRS